MSTNARSSFDDPFDDISTRTLWIMIAVIFVLVVGLFVWASTWETSYDRTLKSVAKTTAPYAESWAHDGYTVRVDEHTIKVTGVDGRVRRYDSTYETVLALREHYSLDADECNRRGDIRVCSETTYRYDTVTFEPVAE